MTAPPARLDTRQILIFWIPLAATWLMMAAEGPFLAAIIARLAEPKFNLAAYGVAFAFAIIIEAPVIMIMSASTALVDDAGSFRKLRNFTYLLNAIISVFMLFILFTPAFGIIARQWIGLPEEVARLTHGALVILLPWPAAIGYRRFFQGLLIREGQTRRVAYGTVIRLCAMLATALTLYLGFELPGAFVGAFALSAGVCIEAAASRWMARHTVRALLRNEGEAGVEPLSYRRIVEFYYPLALTSTISLAVHPMVTFFLGQGRFSLESLAVFPVINALSFIFRSLGLSYQEVCIAYLGRSLTHIRALTRFAAVLGLAASAGLAIIAWTPLSTLWFERISGLTTELTGFALPPTRILMILPALSVLLSLQRAILVSTRHTGPITWATIAEVGGIVLVLALLIHGVDMVGVTAAAIAFIAGRLAGNALLGAPCIRALSGEKLRSLRPTSSFPT